jgi:hypothetical protein
MSDVAGEISPTPSRFLDWSLQIAHRAAIVAMFLLIAGASLKYFHKDAALVLPIAIAMAALVALIGGGTWWRARVTARSTREPRGVAIFGGILLVFGVVMILISRTGKS